MEDTNAKPQSKESAIEDAAWQSFKDIDDTRFHVDEHLGIVRPEFTPGDVLNFL